MKRHAPTKISTPGFPMLRFFLILAGILALLLFLRPLVAADTITGKVIAISDGDTLTILTEGKNQVKVRLAEIDTPESGQPYRNRAREALGAIAFGKTATITVVDTDRYGRTVGRVFVGETDINKELVRQGAAWVYRKYAKDQTLYAAEDEARAAGRGLWALPEAQRCPPWDWRRGSCQKASADPPPSAGSESGNFTCGAKRYCKEMTSCAEARFYLTTCGVRSLDGDRDGVPCNVLCK